MASDHHICLVCNRTIQGLENYVHHKQKQCDGRPSEDSLTGSEHVDEPFSSCGDDAGASLDKKFESATSRKLIIKPFDLNNSDSVFDPSIQKELDRINLKAFLSAVKDLIGLENGELYFHHPSFLDFVSKTNLEKTNAINILKLCQSFNILDKFDENGCIQNHESEVICESHQYQANKNLDCIGNLSYSKQEFSMMKTDKESISDSARKVVSRLSTRIRRPSSRYFSYEKTSHTLPYGFQPYEDVSVVDPNPADRKHFQCRPCDYRADTNSGLQEHVAKDVGQLEKVSSLKSSLICDICCFSCGTNEEMVGHLGSDLHRAHIERMSPTCESLCVLEGETFSVKCMSCGDSFYSPSQLLFHLKSPCFYGMKICFKLANKKSGPSENFHDLSTDHKTDLEGMKAIKRKRGRPPKARSGKPECQHEAQNSRSTVNTTFENIDDFEASRSTEAFKPSFFMEKRLKRCPKIVGDNCNGTSLKKEKGANGEPIINEIDENKFWCKICGLSFLSQDRLNSHKNARTHLRKIEEMHLGDGKNYKCQRCDRLFYALNALQFHELNHALADARHSNLNYVMKKGNEVIKSEKDSASAEIADVTDGSLHQQLKSAVRDNSGRVICPECGKKLSKNGILSHLRQHSGSLPFKCTFCTKEFADVAVLRRHLKVHLGIMYYKCPVCKKQFGRKLTMQAHALREHANEVEKHGVQPPSHQCCQCGRQFMQLNQLTAHMKLHDKQLKCPHLGCTSLFRYKSELSAHLQSHSTERRFLCDECGYTGKSRHQLKRHQRLHAGDKRYQCTSCEYKTTLAANLRRHERVHTGSKPYKCLYCGYSCNTQENLRKHILKTRRHAGKFVYPCQMCDFATNSAQDFQQHLETKHQRDRQTLPSILVGMYQPDDKNNSSNCESLKATNAKNKESIGISFEKLPNSVGAQVINKTSKTASNQHLNLHSKSNDFSPQPILNDPQSLKSKAGKEVSPKPQICSNVSNTQPREISLTSQKQLMSPQIQQLILLASQPSPTLNSVFQLQASRHTIQNLNSVQCLPIQLSTLPPVQQPNLMLSQVADNSMNIKFTLQVAGSHDVANDSNDLASITTPEQLVALLQAAQNKQYLANNPQTAVGIFIPGAGESSTIISIPSK